MCCVKTKWLWIKLCFMSSGNLLLKHLWCLLWLHGLAFIGQLVPSARTVCQRCSQGHVRLYVTREKISVRDFLQQRCIPCFHQNQRQVRWPFWAGVFQGPRGSATEIVSFLQHQHFSAIWPQIDIQRQKRQRGEFPGSPKWLGEHSLPPRCVIASMGFGSIAETCWNSHLIFRAPGALHIQ